jgi:hypothetical protein
MKGGTVKKKKSRMTPASEGDERTAPQRNEPRSRASRDRHPIGNRMGQSSGGAIHLGGEKSDERGGYSEEGMRGKRREPYVGTRMGDWDENPRSSAAASAERAQHARRAPDEPRGSDAVREAKPQKKRAAKRARRLEE